MLISLNNFAGVLVMTAANAFGFSNQISIIIS